MRTLLLILTLTGLLVACSDNGDGQPEEAGAESAESTEQQDQKESGGDDSETNLEAGEPVTKPSPPEEPQSSDEKEQEASGEEAKEDSQDATEADPNKEDSGSGEVAAADIYDRYCVACHEQGMAGAPKLSNSSEWEKRIGERGFAGLVSNSWDGYRAMPAKGTCSDCSREELEATVKWMLDQAEVSF